MKLPSLDTSEGLVVLLGAAAAVYVVYKLYGAAGSISSTVSGSISGAATAIGNLASLAADDANIAIDKARTSSIGAASAPASDQSDAETARLNRDAGLPADTGTLGAFFQPIDFSQLGMMQPTLTPTTPDSPDASGLSSWITGGGTP